MRRLDDFKDYPCRESQYTALKAFKNGIVKKSPGEVTVAFDLFEEYSPEGMGFDNKYGKVGIIGKVAKLGEGSTIVDGKVILRGDEKKIEIRTKEGSQGNVHLAGTKITAHNSVIIESGTYVLGNRIVLHGPDTEIGRGVCIEGHNIVVFGCKIGEKAKVHSNTVIDKGAEIGAGSIISPGCVIGAGVNIPNGVFVPPNTRVTSEEDIKSLKTIEEIGITEIKRILMEEQEKAAKVDRQEYRERGKVKDKYNKKRYTGEVFDHKENAFFYSNSKFYVSNDEDFKNGTYECGDRCLFGPRTKFGSNEFIVGNGCNFQDFVEVFADKVFIADNSIFPHHVEIFCKELNLKDGQNLNNTKSEEVKTRFMGINTSIMAPDATVNIEECIHFEPNIKIKVKEGQNITLNIPEYACIGPANTTFTINSQEEADNFTQMLSNTRRTKEQAAFAKHVLKDNMWELVDGYKKTLE